MKSMMTVVVVLTISLIAGSALAGIGLVSVSPRVDYVAPSNLDGTIGFGAVADLGALTPILGLQFSADYWSSNISSGDNWDWSDFVLGARSRYNLAVDNPAFVPYLTGGLAIHFFSWDFPETVTSLPGYSDAGLSTSESKLGIDLGGGLEFNNNFFVEAQYRIVSDVGQLTLGGGYTFSLGN